LLTEIFNDVESINELMKLFESPEEVNEVETGRLLDLVSSFDKPVISVG